MGMGLQAIDDVGISTQPLSQYTISPTPYVNVAVVTARHDILIVIAQEGHSFYGLVIAMPCTNSNEVLHHSSMAQSFGSFGLENQLCGLVPYHILICMAIVGLSKMRMTPLQA